MVETQTQSLNDLTLGTTSNPYSNLTTSIVPRKERSKVKRLKNKILGSLNQSTSSTPTHYYQAPGATATNSSLSSSTVKLRTTLRRDQDTTDMGSGGGIVNNASLYNGEEFLSPGREWDLTDDDDNNSMDSDLSDYYDTNEKPDMGKKREQRRRDRLKKHITRNAVVPYHHHSSSRKKFNEDKPWKSHKDLDFLTERERKRYEAMWVSNRFRYLNLLSWWPSETSTGADNDEDEDSVSKTNIPVELPEEGLILNLVVQQIWCRSNLPNNLLADIYDRVDTRQDGTLDRRSFVVGMWLVDQCLYGRKLPNMVDQKVWESADRYMVTVTQKARRRQLKEEIRNIKRENKNNGVVNQ